MIRDAIFKKLIHCCSGYEKYSDGGLVEEGYRPDYVLRKGNNYIILESENSSSRKTFVGGMVKAAHFLRNKRKGKLVFVIVPKKNTKAITIANHLGKYLSLIRSVSNLKEVYVVEAESYYKGDILLALDSDDFKNNSFKVNPVVL